MTEDERNRAELVAKVRALAKAKGLPPAALFQRYDANGAGQLDRSELTRLLSDANVGNMFTRGAWVAAVFDQLDKDRSAGLTLGELDGVLAALEPTPPPITGNSPIVTVRPPPAPPAPPPPPATQRGGLLPWILLAGVAWLALKK